MTLFDLSNRAIALALRMGVDVVAMTLLVFGMFYRRYRDKELATAASMFNIFTFAVLSILSTVEFKRITLVARDGGERMTLDTDLVFTSARGTMRCGTDVFILETKSAVGRGFADLCLRRVHERPMQKCSKYCLGMAALGEVDRFNLFLPTMRKLNILNRAA